MSLVLISGPVDVPVSVDEMKAHLRELGSDFDSEILDTIKEATDYVDGIDGWLKRAIIDQTWQLTLDCFPTHEIMIDLVPIIEIVSVKYDDTSGVTQELQPTVDFTADLLTDPGWIFPASSWPSTFAGVNAVRIQFRAGYVDKAPSPSVGTVPPAIKRGIKMITASWYRNKENEIVGDSVAEMPINARRVLRKYRRHLGIA